MIHAAFYMMPPELYDRAFAALEQSGLSIDGLTEADVRIFGLSNFRGPIGYAAVQGDGRDRLLRSVGILPHRRAEGFGKELVRRVEIRSALEAERLHLLTETAAPFFRRLGYADAERASAPAEIAATAQFRSLCPASATYLVKEIS